MASQKTLFMIGRHQHDGFERKPAIFPSVVTLNISTVPLVEQSKFSTKLVV